MTYNLFLDDVRYPSDVKWVKIPNVDYVTVRTYGEFVDTVMTRGLPKFVAFDHDLADHHYLVGTIENEAYTYYDGDLPKTYSYGPERTGYDAAKWLCGYCEKHRLDFPEYVVHSLNVVGAERIEAFIKGWKKHVWTKS